MERTGRDRGTGYYMEFIYLTPVALLAAIKNGDAKTVIASLDELMGSAQQFHGACALTARTSSWLK